MTQIRIALQGGHLGISSGATGAPGEQELNRRIRDRLSTILISKGFQLFLFDANPPANQINQDFNLFLALHGDANVYGTGGGFVDYPAKFNPNGTVQDASNDESKRIHDAIESMYFDNTGIVNHPERSNGNTKYYYMWNELTPATPCVIIEMGVVQDAHDKVILADTDRVANAIARGICKAFNVPFDTIPPVVEPPKPPQVDYKKMYEEAMVKNAALITENNTLKAGIISRDATISQLNTKISNAKQALA